MSSNTVHDKDDERLYFPCDLLICCLVPIVVLIALALFFLTFNNSVENGQPNDTLGTDMVISINKTQLVDSKLSKFVLNSNYTEKDANLPACHNCMHVRSTQHKNVNRQYSDSYPPIGSHPWLVPYCYSGAVIIIGMTVFWLILTCFGFTCKVTTHISSSNRSYPNTV